LRHTGIIIFLVAIILFIMSGRTPFDKLNETNYDDWKIQMEALLEEKGLFGVTCGRDIMPTSGPNSKTFRTFVEKQRLARAKIILCIEPSQIPHIRNESDPAVIWKNLSQIHRARGLGVLLTMRMDFLKMSMSPKSTIATYVASIRHAAYRLEECYRAEEADSFTTSPSTQPPVVSELDKITVLLNGLPSIYQSVIVNITGISLASLTFEDVVTRLMNEEGRLRNNLNKVRTTKPSSDLDEAMVITPGGVPSSQWKGKLFSPAKKGNSIRCHKCGGIGHIRADCPTHDSDAIANVAEEEEEAAFTVDASEEDLSDGVW
jgi:hypothetical protein